MKKRFYQLGKQVLSLSAVIAGTLLFSNQVSAQGVSINGTGTGTAPDASAILDLNVSGITPKKGFLAPRVALTGSGDATTITSPATSLIVYNTATGGGVSPGFYYNSGTPGAPSWVSIGGSGSAPTAGNDIDVTGTVVDIEPILDFVHTINGASSNPLTLNAPLFNDLIFQTSGTERARLTSAGNFGIGDANPASLFTVGSGDLFQVNSSGNLIAINGLTGYSWPAVHASGVLRNNGTGTLTWGAPTISGAAALPNGQIWIGDGSGIAQPQTMSGDATISNTGALTLATVATAGTSTKVTYNAKGLVTSGTAAVLASADFANQGTTTNVLHGNAAGNPSWGAVTGADFGNQVANTVFSGPASGANAIPTFRTMVPLDLATAPTNGEVLGVTAGVLDWVPTLTNPMTNAGDMIYAPVAGSPAAAVRFPAGTNGNVLHTTGGLPSWSPLNMAGGATEVTGILPVDNGGTGVNTIATNGIILGAGTSPVTTLVGTNMQTIRNNAGVWSANNNILDDGTTVGIGLTTADVTASSANFDIGGSRDIVAGDTVALSLRMGDIQNLPTDVVQIAFGYNGTNNYRHNIRTRHNSSGGSGNYFDFYVWDNNVAYNDVHIAQLGNHRMLSLSSDGLAFYGPLLPGDAAGTAGQVLVSGGAGATPTWGNAATGTVTSIATGTGLTGGPITTTGTISMANMTALSVKGNATNGSAAPTDIAATAASNNVLRESGSTVGWGSINLASSGAVGTSILPIANGGTNSSTALNNNRVMISSGGAIVENAALSINSPVYTNGSGILTSTAPTSGAIGYWQRNTTTLSPTTANDNVAYASPSANALAVGLTTANPALQVDASTASSATGLKIKSAAATGGVAVSAISSGTDENLTLDAKGAGTITVNGTATGNISLARNTSITGTETVTSASPSALTVGRLGATTPALQVDASAGTSITGLKITAAASGGGLALTTLGSANEALTINAAGTGGLTINPTATGTVTIGNASSTNVTVPKLATGLVYSTAGVLSNSLPGTNGFVPVSTTAGVITWTDPSTFGSGTNWRVGGNTSPSSPIVGTTDGNNVTLQALGGTGTGTVSILSGTGTGAVNVTTGTGGTTYSIPTGSATGFTLNTNTSPINLGTDAFAHTVTIGNLTGATAVNIKAGTGSSTFETTGAGTLVIGGATSTGAITVGSSTGTGQTVNIGSGATTGTDVVNIATGTATTAKNVNIATGAVSAINMATGNFASTVTINNSASAGLVKIGRSDMLQVDANGVGVGQASSASYKFIVNGKVKSTGINETSDARLKTNFAAIDGALSKVLSMNGKYYDWRTTEFPKMNLEKGRQIGVIAQEMEKILPEVVTTGDDGYKAVEYSHIVPVLIEAIKEQQKIIDGQKSTICDLKASLENVLNRVNIIEKNADLNSSKVEK